MMASTALWVVLAGLAFVLVPLFVGAVIERGRDYSEPELVASMARHPSGGGATAADLEAVLAQRVMSGGVSGDVYREYMESLAREPFPIAVER